MRALIVLLLAASAHAKVVTVPCSIPVEELDLAGAEARLRSQGHDIKHTTCQAGKCEVVFNGNTSAKASDLAPAFTAGKSLRQQQDEAAAFEKAVAAKLEAGTATQAEKDQLLLHLLRKLSRTSR